VVGRAQRAQAGAATCAGDGIGTGVGAGARLRTLAILSTVVAVQGSIRAGLQFFFSGLGQENKSGRSSPNRPDLGK
jgi:hypothetical protein